MQIEGYWTITEAAAELGCSAGTLQSRLFRGLITAPKTKAGNVYLFTREELEEARKFKPARRGARAKPLDEKVAEASELAEMYKTMTLEEIGIAKGVTRERIRQKLKWIGVNRDGGFVHKSRLSKSAEKAVQDRNKKEKRCRNIYGCSFAEFCEINGNRTLMRSRRSTIARHYAQNRNNASRAYITWKLTLPEYAALLGRRVDEIRRGGLSLGRKDKTGPFSFDNCEFVMQAKISSDTRSLEKARKKPIALSLRQQGRKVSEIAREVHVSEATVKGWIYQDQMQQAMAPEK